MCWAGRFTPRTFRKLDFGAGSSIAMLLGAITLALAILFYVFLDRGTEPE